MLPSCCSCSRPDYTHYAWYYEIKAFKDYSLPMIAPVTFFHLGMNLHERINPERFAPRFGVRDDKGRYGADVRAAPSFQRNLETSIELATERGQKLLELQQLADGAR